MKKETQKLHIKKVKPAAVKTVSAPDDCRVLTIL
jgi:hypothetical protein